LSSILEALKKAEQESIAERGGKISGPVRLPKRSPYALRKRRWWLPLGLVAVACIGIVLFWRFPRPGTSPPEPARVPPPASQARTSSPPPIHPPEETVGPTAPKEQTPPKQIEDQAALSKPEQKPGPVVSPAQPAAPPAEKRMPPTPSPAVPETEPPAVEAPKPQAPTPPVDSIAAATEEIQRQPQKSTDTIPTVPPPAKESRKTYRSDPRIELQALVWAPEAPARFVVINNRLLKEGGSTDGITVLQINRDDVLLSEGADRWHEKFKIR